jgi:hypothetical protein
MLYSNRSQKKECRQFNNCKFCYLRLLPELSACQENVGRQLFSDMRDIKKTGLVASRFWCFGLLFPIFALTFIFRACNSFELRCQIADLIRIALQNEVKRRQLGAPQIERGGRSESRTSPARAEVVTFGASRAVRPAGCFCASDAALHSQTLGRNA